MSEEGKTVEETVEMDDGHAASLDANDEAIKGNSVEENAPPEQEPTSEDVEPTAEDVDTAQVVKTEPAVENDEDTQENDPPRGLEEGESTAVNDADTTALDEKRTEDGDAISESQDLGDKETESQSAKGDNASERTVSVSTIRLVPQVTDSQVMEDDETTYAALRGKANTPASVFTELTEGRDGRTLSRPSAGVRTQEAFYRKAVDLISARCSSSVKMVSTEPLMGVKDPPPGFGAPRVFYIHQRRPRPMTPLKVWRGYHGNVYFEPMKINQASVKEPAMEVTLPPMHRCSEKLQTVISHTRWNPEHTLRYRQHRLMYTPVPQDIPPSERYKNSRQPVLVLDRETLQRDPEKLDVFQSLESTGTLRIHTAAESQPQIENGRISLGSPTPTRATSHKAADRSKVCRGSVARKLVMFRNLMIPLMQEQRGKITPDRSPVESRAELHTRDSSTKLPSINQQTSGTPTLRIK